MASSASLRNSSDSIGFHTPAMSLETSASQQYDKILHAVSKVDSPPYLVLRMDSLEVLAMYRPVHQEVKSRKVLPHLQGIDLYARTPYFVNKMKVILTI